MALKRSGRILLPINLLFVVHPAMADPDPGYYDNVDTSTSQTLRASLHEIIDDHTRFPYTSSETDTWDVLEIADEDRQNPSNIVSIYRNASFLKRGGGNDFYNREHTWPRSYGFPDNGPQLNYPFTDMHHLFLADSDYNFYRSNMPYDNCDASCWEYETVTNDDRGGAGGGYPGDSNWATGHHGRDLPRRARQVGDLVGAQGGCGAGYDVYGCPLRGRHARCDRSN